MPELNEKRVMVCKATGKPVEMVYQGKDSEERDQDNQNGHPGWLCLHDDEEQEAP